MIDLVILTDKRYLVDNPENEYHHNVYLEDSILKSELETLGFSVDRTNWDNPTYNWSKTQYAIFRTTWDYFSRFTEFYNWLQDIQHKVKLIHSLNIIHWNMDKRYFKDLTEWGIPTIDTVYIPKNSLNRLETYFDNTEKLVLKPQVSGAAMDTFLIAKNEAHLHQHLFIEMCKKQNMMIQPYQHNIRMGEISFMIFGGKYSHAVLKKAKKGDFRVQDDFGGYVMDYIPTNEEITFVEDCLSKLMLPNLVYARVDVIRNNENKLVISELELIEPEIWLRRNKKAGRLFAKAIKDYILTK